MMTAPQTLSWYYYYYYYYYYYDVIERIPINHAINSRKGTHASCYNKFNCFLVNSDVKGNNGR